MRNRLVLWIPTVFALSIIACETPPEELGETTSALSRPAGGVVPTEVVSLNGFGCIDAPLDSNNNIIVGQVQQFPCNAGNNQDWYFEDTGGGVFRIHSWHNSNLCLDLPWGHTTVNTPVNIFPCNGGSNQLWLVVSDGHGQPTIRPLNADPTTGTRNCLDVTNGVYNGQAGLQLFTCLNQTNQEWKFGTWLHTDNESSGWFGWSCDGVVAFATATGTRWIGQGEVGAFRTDGYSGQVPELCSDGAFNQHTTDCPAATNWMVVDRRPGNDVTVACFQQ